MTAAIPPDRKHLAAMLRVHAHAATLFSAASKRDLIQYLQIAEDTIEQQAIWLAADGAEFDRRAAVRRTQGEVIGELGRRCDDLHAQNSRLNAQIVSLHHLVEAALDAGQQDDGEAIGIIRAALEGTS